MEKHNNHAYVAVLEILFLGKLYNLRREALQKNFKQIRELAQRFNISMEEHIEINCVIFNISDTRLNSLINILKFSLDMHLSLLKSRNIFDFNIFVFRANIDTKQILRKLKIGLFDIMLDNKVWLLEKSTPVIGHSIEIDTTEGEIQEVISVVQKDREPNLLEKCREELLFHTDERNALERAVENINVRIVGITGKTGVGKTIFLQQFCQSRQSIYVSCYSIYQEPFYPFLSLISALYHDFYEYFSAPCAAKLDHLFEQIQLTRMLTYKQLEFDISWLFADLAKKIEILFVFDNLDCWPIEALEFFRLLCKRLEDIETNFTIVCAMKGVFYPIGLDEIIHFSGAPNLGKYARREMYMQNCSGQRMRTGRGQTGFRIKNAC